MTETDNTTGPLFPRATDFKGVTPLDGAIAKIGEDGNIGALLMQMAENDVIAVMLVDDAFKDKDEIPFNPLVLGDEEFGYVPFFDSEKALGDWMNDVPEESQAVLAPVVLRGAGFFPALSHSQGLHTVLNPHLEAREVIYHDNLVWIRHKVEATQGVPGQDISNMNVIINTGPNLPKGANQDAFLADVTAYLPKTAVNVAYLLVSDGFDKAKNQAFQGAQVMVEGVEDDALHAMDAAFGFDPEKYDLPKGFTFSFMTVPQTDAGQQLIQQIEPFYNKEK